MEGVIDTTWELGRDEDNIARMFCIQFGFLTPRHFLSQLDPEDWEEWKTWFRRHPFGDQFIIRQIAELNAAFSTVFGGWKGKASELLLDFWRVREEDTTPEDVNEPEPLTQEERIRRFMEAKGKAEGWHTVPKEFRPKTTETGTPQAR